MTRGILQFDLMEETEALRREHGWRDNGHSAKTLVKHHDQRIVLIAMKRGARMMQHRTAGAVSIHVLSGLLRVTVREKVIEVAGGGLLALDRSVPHDVEAIEDSGLVLSVCSTRRKRSVNGAARSK